jgi:uncharacterized protein YukE
MAKFTVKSDIVAVDKSSKTALKINKAYEKLTKTVTRESQIADKSYSKFSKNFVLKSKKVMVSANNLNSKINNVFRGISKRLGSLGLFVGFSSLILGLKNSINKFADFEQANAGLAAVMGVTVEQNEKLIRDSKRLGAITAKSATEVTGLQEAYARLGFEQRDIINMTESTIAGSVAMRGELDQTAELVGAMVKSFDKFGSIDAPDIIDKMTLSTQKSALNFEKLQVGLPIVAGAANAAEVRFTKLLASMGKLSDAGIDASSSSTALRNIFLESAKRGVPYETLIQKIADSTDKLKIANELFGKRGAVAAVVLSKNIDSVNKLDESLQKAKNTAQEAATKQLNTLKGSLTILKSAWEGWILSLDDGNGKFSGFLKTVTKVATEVLSLATGTAKANSKLNEAEKRIRKIATIVTKVLKLLKFLTLAFIAFKTAIILSRIALTAYNIALGITGALSKTAAIGIGSNTIALGAYKVASGVATAAQWLLNTALYGFPLVWILAAIAAVVAGIIYLAKNWDKVTAAMEKDWNRIKTSFNKDGLGGVFKMWGKDLLIYLIDPLIGVLAIISKITKGKHGEKSLNDMIARKNRLLVEAGRGDEMWIKKQSINSYNYGASAPSEALFGNKSYASNSVTTKGDNLINALNKNSLELEKNTDVARGEWSGKFRTTILKDANISESASKVVQRELATSVINNENNIINNQRESVQTPQGIVTGGASNRKSNSENNTVTLYIVDQTGDKFGFQVEGTGVNVITTGN